MSLEFEAVDRKIVAHGGSCEGPSRGCGIHRPACGETAARHLRKPDLGAVRGRFRESELVETSPHRAEPGFSLGSR
jgi:hypothetical protein